MIAQSFRISLGLALLGVFASFVGCVGNQSLTNLSADELFQRGKRQYEKKQYLSSIETFHAVVYNFPGNSVVDTAQFFLAMSHYGNQDYALAAVEFNRLAVNYPSSVYAVQAQFMKGVSTFEGAPKHFALDQTELESAIRLLEDFVVDHPESELIADAQKYLKLAHTRLARKLFEGGLVYTRINAPAAAKIYYQKVADDYTDTEFAPLAIFGIAQAEYNLGNYDLARTRFENFRTVFPTNTLVAQAGELAAKSAFMAGKQAFEKKDYARAREQFALFIKSFPQDRHVGKAREYLRTIGEEHAIDTANAKAGS